jgi:kynurenine formamidase
VTWIYLSHVLRESTPLYGGAGEIRINSSRSLTRGDSSNNSELMLPAHTGTHVDAPRHFDPQGMTLDQYPPDYWRAERPALVEIPSNPGQILSMERMGMALETVPQDCDMLLLRTGAEAWRSNDTDVYSKQGPGVAAEVALWLRAHRRIKMLGMDFISVSSFAHRELGREAHRAFLGSGKGSPILLVEDMALSALPCKMNALDEVWVVPMLYADSDGAPATVLARTRV